MENQTGMEAARFVDRGILETRQAHWRLRYLDLPAAVRAYSRVENWVRDGGKVSEEIEQKCPHCGNGRNYILAWHGGHEAVICEKCEGRGRHAPPAEGTMDEKSFREKYNL